MKRIFCLLAVLFCTFLLLDVSAQGEYATPKSGEVFRLFWNGTNVREKPTIMSL